MKYIFDSRFFDGSCLTSMSDDLHSDYGGETLEELREREKNPSLIAVSPGRMALLVKRYSRALSRPFREITEERYCDLFECLPPARMGRGWFFVGEPYYGSLYPFCFRSGDRFFMAERPLRLTDPEIQHQMKGHMEKLYRHPKIVKGEPFLQYMAWYNADVAYIPYSFILEGKKLFLRNLATRTGSVIDDRRNRDELARLLRNLRANHYEYCTFHSVKKDIFEFFEWVRKNRYTLAIHGTLFDFAPDHSYVDFHGNVCEYSAAFHYRIYSRPLFGDIINQLRCVKRHLSYKKEV